MVNVHLLHYVQLVGITYKLIRLLPGICIILKTTNHLYLQTYSMQAYNSVRI